MFFSGLIVGLRLPDLPFSVPRGYLVIRNALWGLVCMIGAAALFSGRAWAPRLVRLFALGLTIWYWVDRLIWSETLFDRQTRPISALLTLLILGLLFGILNRPSVRAYFGENRP
jgi:hypothetical protein